MRDAPVVQILNNRIYEHGETTGVLSAGCFEQDVCERAAKVMSNGEPLIVKYDTTSDDDIVWGLGLGCSGVIHVLIEPATNERIASLMQLLAECSESSRGGAIATTFYVEGDVETTIGTSALMFPDGTVDGQFVSASIFDDLREAVELASGSIKRYETADGYVDVFVEYVQPRVRIVIFGAGFDVLPVVDRTGVQLRQREGSIHESFTTLLTPRFSLPITQLEVSVACKV